eukprot:g20341.t1
MAGLWTAPEEANQLLVVTSQEHERSGQTRVLVAAKDGPMRGAVFRVVKGKKGTVMSKECKGYNKMGKGKPIFSDPSTHGNGGGHSTVEDIFAELRRQENAVGEGSGAVSSDGKGPVKK